MRTKVSTPELEALYDELIDVIKSYPITTVFAAGVNDLTTVVYEAEPYRVRFYLFSNSPQPVAELSNKGTYLVLHPFQDTFRPGDHYISEERIITELKATIHQAMIKRDQACSLDTRMTYEELFNATPVAQVTKNRQGNRGMKLAPRT